MAHGRAEARITFSGARTFTWTDSAGGPLVASVAGGNYFPTELAAAVQAAIVALAGTVGDAATVTLSRGETGATGRVTITTSATPWSLTWGSSELRDALGFTADISGVSAPQTGAQHARGLWLPDCHMWSPYGGGAAGSHLSDYSASVTPNGATHALVGNSFRVQRGIRWAAVSNRRAMAHFEQVVNESFESWMLDVKMARFPNIPVNPYVRLIWNADVDGTYAVGKLLWPSEFDLDQFQSNWTGKFAIPLPTLVVES